MSEGVHFDSNGETARGPGGADERDGGVEIPRGETGVRIALTLLFVLVAAVIESAIAVIVLFQLVFALVTQRAPSPGVRELANRIVAYYYRIGRYLTYNEPDPPFPFSDLPEPVEPDAWDDAETAR